MKYSRWSAIFGLICAITIFSSYAIAPKQPEGPMVVFLQMLFFTSIITGLLSLVYSYIGFRNKEKGILKKIAPMIVGIILLVYIISFVGMVISFM